MTDEQDAPQAHPMEIPPEHDPELARQRLAEDLLELGWSADEGTIDVGYVANVTEPAVLRPDHRDTDDVEWELVYQGVNTFLVRDPSGSRRGEIELSEECEPLDRFSDPAVAYYRTRAVELVRSGERTSVFLPLLSRVEKNGPEVEIYDAGVETPIDRDRDPRKVVLIRELSTDVLNDAYAEWQEEWREVHPELASRRDAKGLNDE